MPQSPEELEIAHVAAARGSFRYWFQACVQIPLKDKSGNDGGLAFPRMNILQDRMETALELQQADNMPMRTITGKFRQGGSSRYHMNRAYWMGRNRPLEIGVIADDKNTTPRLLNMWEVAYREDRFGDRRWGNAPACQGFPRKFSHGSQLWEETANDPRAGQGGTLQVLISSETAHYRSSGHSTGEAVFQSIANTVPDLPGTWIGLESTANGRQGVYYFTYKGAASLTEWRNGIRKSGFIRVFAAWFEDQGYVDKVTPDEEKAILDSLTESEIRLIERFGPDKITPGRLAWRRRILASPKMAGDEQKFNQEYPSDEESMFIGTGTQVFDLDGLQELEMRQSTAGAVRWGTLTKGVFLQTGLGEAWLRVWEEPQEGRSYLIACDFMEGEQADGSREQDCHAVGVWRQAYVDENGRHHRAAMVAAIKLECRVNLDILCGWIGEMARWYGDCLVVPEVNNAFGIVELLAKAGVLNFWMREAPLEGRRVGEGKRLRKRGWMTTEPLREQIVATMQGFIREQELDVRCPGWLSEMANFIAKANGRKEAAAGHHDDWVLMSCIAVQCLPAATRYVRRLVPQVRNDGTVYVDEHTDLGHLGDMGVMM